MNEKSPQDVISNLFIITFYKISECSNTDVPRGTSVYSMASAQELIESEGFDLLAEDIIEKGCRGVEMANGGFGSRVSPVYEYHHNSDPYLRAIITCDYIHNLHS